MRAELQQLGHSHERGRAAARAGEERHHLRYRGHLHPARPDRSGRRADDQSDQNDDRAGAREVKLRHGGAQSDDHAGGGGVVAVAGRPRRAELLEAEDEQDRGEEVRQGVDSAHLDLAAGSGVFAACRPLNISSIRSVTTKPPTTLVVARTTARNPRTILTGALALAASSSAASRMMPWIALVPDINGEIGRAHV